MIFHGSTTLGPTCQCWKPDRDFLLDPGQNALYDLDICNTQGLDSGMVVAVQGLPYTPPPDDTYYYNESPFVLSLLITEQSDPTKIVTIRPGVENVIRDNATTRRFYYWNSIDPVLRTLRYTKVTIKTSRTLNIISRLL